MCNRIVSGILTLAALGIHANGLVGDLCKEGRDMATAEAHHCPVQKEGQELKHGLYKEIYPDGKNNVAGGVPLWPEQRSFPGEIS